jgi:hypothetical protein
VEDAGFGGFWILGFGFWVLGCAARQLLECVQSSAALPVWKRWNRVPAPVAAIGEVNAPDHRPGASGDRNESEALSPGAMYPVCSALWLAPYYIKVKSDAMPLCYHECMLNGRQIPCDTIPQVGRLVR